jgi:hypothetical protein
MFGDGAAVAAAADLAIGGRLGGLPYGLEPLTLPDPETSAPEGGTRADVSSPQLLASCRDLLTAWQDPDTLPSVDAAEFAREIYWFRWITGHQVSFIIWRLMAQADRRLQEEEHDRRDTLQTLTRYVHGYCAMLLYTSSCTPEIYNGWIRTSMYLQHRGFSGGWAPDFAPVRHLFRVRQWQSATVPEAVELRRAVRLYKSIHAGVAAKLVPNGRSLLRNSGQTPRTQEPRLLGMLYDNYFLTLRSPIGHESVVDQLLRRLAAIGQDIAANGLHLSASDAHESAPVELRSDEVGAIEQDFYSVCFAVAGAAAGLSASSVTAELASAHLRQLGA